MKVVSIVVKRSNELDNNFQFQSFMESKLNNIEIISIRSIIYIGIIELLLGNS